MIILILLKYILCFTEYFNLTMTMNSNEPLTSM